MNTTSAEDAERALMTCCASRHWARRLADHRPYPDLDALLAAADEASYDLGQDDLGEALAAEPPKAALPAGGAHGAAATALRAATAAYESRFRHAFVICLDDIAPSEALDHVLASLRDRLGNDPEEERALAAEELRCLARGRLARLLRTAPPQPTQAAVQAAVQAAAQPAVQPTPGTGTRRPGTDTWRNSPYVPV
ncbi:2-oxo-4-hydroxy-4-carboxy-5-ureidoimidazoline decarboxylase [Streptomyces aureocirculatus]|uniref:2-oxo-4-hydroxy-4-carboxy-5-ureidoimidazoline decarboxylase n=1 Tax=Streptomyces aureocirculatus TaxID=67275 RepID=UPI00099B7EC3|nr:2-oxo-4-hydroxy-4-carboxy-5-ureidoimidazoline decarboxylase [Streptomyces aureocirculatus]